MLGTLQGYRLPMLFMLETLKACKYIEQYTNKPINGDVSFYYGLPNYDRMELWYYLHPIEQFLDQTNIGTLQQSSGLEFIIQLNVIEKLKEHQIEDCYEFEMILNDLLSLFDECKNIEMCTGITENYELSCEVGYIEFDFETVYQKLIEIEEVGNELLRKLEGVK